jgi:hypothetical protein
LALRIDSQSIQQTADNAKTTMENQYSKLKGKNLDALDRIDTKRFCIGGIAGTRFRLKVFLLKLPLQANSTSLVFR